MNNVESGKFIKLIVEAYQNFQPTPGRVKLWAEMLTDIDFETAIKRLRAHIKTNRFVPTIAEILNPDGVARQDGAHDELGDLIPGALDRTPY